MAVAPPPEWGAIPTPPRRNGGNMDNKELVAGKTVYLPVFTEGALFSGGDRHGAQALFGSTHDARGRRMVRSSVC
jgi:acetamidase/formamidase